MNTLARCSFLVKMQSLHAKPSFLFASATFMMVVCPWVAAQSGVGYIEALAISAV